MEVAHATQEQTSLQLAPHAGASKASAKSAPGKQDGIALMNEAVALKNPSKYKQEWKAFALACNKYIPGAPAGGWCLFNEDGDTVNPDSLPEFKKDTVFKFAAYLLDDDNKYNKADMCNSRAAVNHYYQQAGRPGPWTGSVYWRTMSCYKGARIALNLANGKTDGAAFRSAVHEDVYKWMLDEAEKPSTSAYNKTAYILLLLGWLFALRAGSTSLSIGDVRFARDSNGRIATVIVDSESLKMQDGNPSQYKQRRCPAPDPALGPKHPRARLFTLFEWLVEEGNISISGTPEQSSGIVTKWMKDLIPADIANLPEKHFYSSHSTRRAAASAMHGIGVPLELGIMSHGRWKSATSCLTYIEEGYQVSRFAGGMFDWLMDLGPQYQWRPGILKEPSAATLLA